MSNFKGYSSCPPQKCAWGFGTQPQPLIRQRTVSISRLHVMHLTQRDTPDAQKQDKKASIAKQKGALEKSTL